MIAVDTNILVYAHRRDSEWHEPAFVCLASLAEGQELWGVPWPCIHEFLAIATHPRVYRRGTGKNSGPSWKTGKITGAAVQVARVAAICREHGVRELWSADRDFTRFSGLVVRHPLVG